ncbi:MAG: DUF2007 domain-containing protein [Amphritea sp.]|nr:DUF2007 domain-containing protein [Amphritea sp.]
MQEIYRAADITEAHIIAGMLESHGIEAHVGGHYLQGGVGELGTMNFATIAVQEEDAEQAGQLIADYEQGGDEPVRLSQKEGVKLPQAMYILLFWVVIAVTAMLIVV